MQMNVCLSARLYAYAYNLIRGNTYTTKEDGTGKKQRYTLRP